MPISGGGAFFFVMSSGCGCFLRRSGGKLVPSEWGGKQFYTLGVGEIITLSPFFVVNFRYNPVFTSGKGNIILKNRKSKIIIPPFKIKYRFREALVCVVFRRKFAYNGVFAQAAVVIYINITFSF